MSELVVTCSLQKILPCDATQNHQCPPLAVFSYVDNNLYQGGYQRWATYVVSEVGPVTMLPGDQC